MRKKFEKYPEKWPKQLTTNYTILGDIREMKRESMRGLASSKLSNQ
jgi:hypothetical protein